MDTAVRAWTRVLVWRAQVDLALWVVQLFYAVIGLGDFVASMRTFRQGLPLLWAPIRYVMPDSYDHALRSTGPTRQGSKAPMSPGHNLLDQRRKKAGVQRADEKKGMYTECTDRKHWLLLTGQDLLAAAKQGDFFSYAAGVAYRIVNDHQVSRESSRGSEHSRWPALRLTTS